jgi:aspartate aminotransferase
MASAPVSQSLTAVLPALSSVLRFFTESTFARREHEPNICNFAVGNPHEMPLNSFVNALQTWSVPQNKDWYGYKMSETPAQKVVAESLRASRGVAFEPQDIAMTNGGFAAIAVALKTVVDLGDEVIFITPPWFFYEALIITMGGTPVRVNIRPDNFDLDINAISSAITAKTRAIIINSPNNPTGKIYPPETLQALAGVLTKASQRNGRTIYLLSDEAYSRILFDGRSYYSPAVYYPDTFLLYTYGKTLLTPGQRLGFIALPPAMPEREQIRMGIMLAQLMTGYAFPNALLQHALGDLEKLSIDIEHLQYKRDWMVNALREMGYDLHVPEGTFYLLPRSPLADDFAFCELLAEHNILCLPGEVVEMPGYFRISLTANDSMIERAMPGFALALEQAKSAQGVR